MAERRLLGQIWKVQHTDVQERRRDRERGLLSHGEVVHGKGRHAEHGATLGRLEEAEEVAIVLGPLRAGWGWDGGRHAEGGWLESLWWERRRWCGGQGGRQR